MLNVSLMKLKIVFGVEFIAFDFTLGTFAITKASLINTSELVTKLCQIFANIRISRSVITVSMNIKEHTLWLVSV